MFSSTFFVWNVPKVKIPFELTKNINKNVIPILHIQI